MDIPLSPKDIATQLRGMSHNDWERVQLYRAADTIETLDYQVKSQGESIFNLMEMDAEHHNRALEAEKKLESFISVRKRISEYLFMGGLFNPEMMEHDKVRDLIRDIADVIDGVS